MNFVIDASVAVKWYIPEIYEQEAAKILQGNHNLHAPELILTEFSNIIWKKVRRAETTPTEGEKIVSTISRKRWTIHPHRRIINSAYAGAVSTGQTVYDWTYLALAVSLSYEFVTADEKFYMALERSPLKSNLLWIGDI